MPTAIVPAGSRADQLAVKMVAIATSIISVREE
jgi:hypothetical protein